MSRIGKQIIVIPSGVEVTLNGDRIKVKGPKGELEMGFSPSISVSKDDHGIRVKRSSDEPSVRGLHGLTRALIANMIKGVSSGFEKRLEIIGVGYRAQVSGKKLTLNLGFSHPIELNVPEGITAEMDKESKNILIISGIDKQLVGQFAANARSFRPPEPYKGKGIRYVDEYVARKAGKSAAGGAK
ncbi:50S ribosomal protein L6 [Patescibacteria group bacterium]|nr:50S ribosomal protein L6 [Patescibacteria group bacterium]MBU1016441.1 50S ribosomal protein L6 [Patescibacteria group bacterium]MBU1684939.1 50S ribosomal protein L6 [Patescibacteria group bacterium]MBU1939033.1 50S ribosomal protein L6 [Patescibacteria group bacterium]